MTHAGTITVGVDIDANGLGEKLAAVVRSQLGPALGKIGQDWSRNNTGVSGALDGVTKAATDAAKAAERTAKSTDKASQSAKKQKTTVDDLTEATKRANKAQDEFSTALELFGRKSPEAAAAYKRMQAELERYKLQLTRTANESRSSTDSQINDYRRLADAAERARISQEKAARLVGINTNRTAAGGGGRGGFFGGGGVGGFLTSPGGLAALGLGAQALAPATLAVTNLAGAIVQLGQAGLVLPGLFAGGAASIGTAVIGFQGMGDAIKAINKGMEEGASKGDLKKMAAALKDMNGNAKEVALTVATDVLPALKKVKQDTVQQNMFDGIAPDLKAFTDKVLPTVDRGLGGIAKSWNDTLKKGMGALSDDQNLSLMDRVFGNTAEGQKRANAAIAPITRAMLQLSSVGSEFLPRLGDAVTKVTTRFGNWVDKNVASGQMWKWIDEGLNGMRAFGNSLLNVGKMITGLTKAAGGDGGFLGWLERVTGKWAEFVNSTDGQSKISKFFDDARESGKQWLPILKDVVSLAGDVLAGFRDWGGVILPVLGQITGFLSSMPGLVQTAVTAFAGFRTVSWLGGLLGLGGAGAGAGAGGRGLLGALLGGGGLLGGPLGIGLAGAGLLAGGVTSSAGPDGPGWGSGLSTIGGGALLGGAIGSVVPVIGTTLGAAIGAGAGAITVAIQALVKSLDDGRRNWEQKWNADNGPKSDPTRPGSPDVANALTGRDKILQPSLNTPPVAGALLPALAAGQVKGYTLGPNGQIVGPDGAVVNLPPELAARLITGPAPATVQPPAPVVVPPMPPAPKPGSGLAGLFPNLPGAPGIPTPTISSQDPAQTIASLATSIKQLPEGKVEIKADDIPKVKDDLSKLNVQIDDVSKNQIVIKANTNDAQTTIDALIRNYQSKTIQLQVTAAGGGAAPTIPGGPPRADGGVLPGFSPGVDNMLVPMSGGEGVVIPEAMRALGGSWLYSINSRFRAGLSRRGYATGGVVGADGALGAPDSSVIGLLTQIRDALLGRGSSALATTADNTTTMAQALGPKAKPFGGDVGKGALAGAIRALGGDPNQMDWGGFTGDGQLLVPKGATVGPGGQIMVPTGASPANMAAMAQMLEAFARSGNTADLGMGLTTTSPVVRAIVAARNKKNGLSDDTISGLVGQVLTGGGYSGVLDSSNTSLINALTTFQQKQLAPPKGQRGQAAAGQFGYVPMGGFDAALLSQVPAGQYSQAGAADLTKGLADCSSAVEDLVNLMDGMPTGGRQMSTGNAADWLTSRGFIPTSAVVPGAMNVAFNSGHMQATLPDGTPFNWGSDAAAARGGVGGTGAADPALNQRYYRPATGMPPGAGLSMGMSANPLGYSGGPVPVYIVDGPGAAFGQQLAGQVAGDALSAMGPPLADAAGSIISGIDKGTQLERDSTKNRPATPTSQLMKEGNPLSVAALAGYKVPDFTRNGWSGPVNTNAGPGFTAGGQMISDTSAIIQRSFTDMEAANDARQQQLLAVLDAIKSQLSEQVLKPIIQSAVTAALQAAGSAASSGTSPQLPGLAAGGGITGGVAGKDSVPALLMPGEHVFTTGDVARMGGQRGVYAFRRALYANGGAVQHFATGGGVNVNKTVGADFFGVGQVPIIGPLINLLINVLLQIIGVNITAADTLNEISQSFDQFRGDFKRFDATGRVTSDTSALSDRSGSSKEKAVDERVRIFKEVLSGLIKFIIQKIIIPITQAVMQTLLSTASSAVSGAIAGGINTVAPGAGGIAGNLIGGLMNSAGGAAINIGGELISQLVGAATGPIVEMLTGGIMDMFGGLLSPILSGGIGGLVSMFLPFLAFDSGGVANGMGLLPKATVEPERVLSPRQTSLFEDMVRANFGTNSGPSQHVTLHAPITVVGGGEQAAHVAHDRLLKLMS
ncbi:hypothetical protein [Mycolicibacterium mucogenicum]|uniref:Tape measure protein n=1 Tax=Mycolicibacterium mucogenicum DSM 44124 TaxID=1226753 RepID=A0A8E4W371_MYCMU|nr:hypothetical protein MMUC44124_00845 [Mycolicibacterium mucogenicum DSM 44124]QPG69983.1 hypothetical protein C1S78_002840 [Mycolicibacterium mucogenicum DSM 44124]